MRRPPAIRSSLLAVSAVLAIVQPAHAAPDPDVLRVTHAHGTIAVTEGDAGHALTVSLRRAPASFVTIAIVAPGLVAEPATLTFTPTDATHSQAVTITAPDDSIPALADERHVTLATSSTDADFDSLATGFEVAVHDDDAVAVLLEHTDGATAVTEGGATDTVLLRLGTRPREPVTVFVEGAGLDATPDTVVVVPDRWDDGIPVVLGARSDLVAQGSRDTALTSHTKAPQALWNALSAGIPVTVHDATALRSATDVTIVDPRIPPSLANRAPSNPRFSLPAVWPRAGSVALRFRSTDADGDAVRYRVLHRSHPWGALRPRSWELLGEVTGTRFDAGPIEPLEQRCFRVEAVDPMGAASSTSVTCTHGIADDGAIAKRYGWVATRQRGAWNGTASTSSRRGRLLYFTHTGSHAQVTFLRCRTCASVELVDVEDRHRTISLRGTGRRTVTVPLRRTGRRVWGFYVRGPGPVRFDSYAVVRDS